MEIVSQQLGCLEYGEQDLLSFPDGILGFPQWHGYLLVDQDDVAPLRWLQPVDEPAVTFTVLDPYLFIPDYRVRLGDEDRTALDLKDEDEPAVLVLVTIPEDPSQMTANLLGPLVFNPRTSRGRQLVLHDSGYPIRHPLVAPAPEAEAATPPAAV
ncbi:MAG: flagellar assembly protein FliW [Candidatus Sericytochromatia bacterium]|nr:flagellar assembly protein FliW [Candidatus Sericytochromatia bacterium]